MAIKKILVRAPNWIGDAVMSLPALEALKSLYPSADIYLLAKSRVVPVFENNPAISGFITVEGGRHKGFFGALRLSGELRERDFDLAVLFQNAFGAALVAFLSGVKERVGYARDMRSGLLTKAVPVSAEIKKKHQVFYYLNIIKALGAKVPEAPVPKIYISDREKAAAKAFLEREGLSGKPVFGAAPGAAFGPAKRWPSERFASVLKGLVDEYKGCALVFGGPDDKEACSGVKAALPSVTDLSGRITLRESIALVALTRVFITNDSGPMHLAAAIGVPTVGIFGSTEDSLTGPVGRKAVSVREKIDCSPCFKRECPFGHYDCLKRVEAARVLAKAREMME
ncbi:MAG: lipopolysaccharide heptosyltransferase II [Deltaproteobacteria bacterium]|nr:lipopolysaccharide heptosyltransferase II [Deltaproteobacteria bacterium]